MLEDKTFTRNKVQITMRQLVIPRFPDDFQSFSDMLVFHCQRRTKTTPPGFSNTFFNLSVCVTKYIKASIAKGSAHK